MQKIDLYISKDAPNVRNGAWLKPVEGGFELLVLDGNWKPLKIAAPKAEVDTKVLEELKTTLIGSVQDKKSANTINGARAYAKAVEDKLNTYIKNQQ